MALPRLDDKDFDWGPKALRARLKKLAKAINLRTPKAGTGITVAENPDGCQISTSDPTTAGLNAGLDVAGGGGGGGTSGTPVDLYGAVNGEPAVFHLLQSSPPDPV